MTTVVAVAGMLAAFAISVVALVFAVRADQKARYAEGELSQLIREIESIGENVRLVVPAREQQPDPSVGADQDDRQDILFGDPSWVESARKTRGFR